MLNIVCSDIGHDLTLYQDLSLITLLLYVYHCMALLIIRGGLAEILCKPKILPLKSSVLEQLQKMDQANEANSTASQN